MSTVPQRRIGPRSAPRLPDEAPARAPRFSEYVDSQINPDAQNTDPDEVEVDEAPANPPKFTEWLDDAPIDTTYHEHVGPLKPGDLGYRGGR